MVTVRMDRTRTNAMNLIEPFGGGTEAKALDAMAQKQGINDDEREQVTESARKIRAKRTTAR